jgi:cytochrome c biogenesis protein CcmG/thiol:disulfide interchange protein DsbE
VPEKKQKCRVFSWSGRLRARAILALGLCGLLATACDRGDHPGQIGSRAQQFTVSDGTQTVTLANLRGHVVVLNFWATSCIPCVEEVPSLVELQRRMPQLTVVAISNDEDDAVYRQFLTDNHVNFATVRDPSFRIPTLYGTIKIPETYVIDRKGVLRRKFVSAQNWTTPEIMDYLGKL